MFGRTYAISWTGADGSPCAGRLDIEGHALILTGGRNGCRAQETIPFREIDDVHVKSGRLVITMRSGRSLSIRSLDAPGILHELAERLATCA